MIAVVLLSAGCAGVRTQSTSSNLPDINPNAESASKDSQNVTLYFSYRGEELLAGETVTLNVPVNESLEYAVVRALINGPTVNRSELSGLFWEGVKLVRVNSSADILFITLNEAFVSSEPEKVVLEDGTVADQKKLAICSIVNTIVEMGKYSSVQIYVDKQQGVGQGITRGEAGWETDVTKRLEPLGRMKDMILTPQNTLGQALDSFMKQDWTRLYNFTAYNNPDGSVKPEIKAFSDALSDKGNALESFNVVDNNVSGDGQKAIVMLDYTMKTREGDSIERPNVPVVLVREEGIWKLTYPSLVDVLINAG